MYVEVRKGHKRTNEFIEHIKTFYPDARIDEYDTSYYVECSARVINFFSAITHDLVLIRRVEPNKDLPSFPIEMFGTIDEL